MQDSHLKRYEKRFVEKTPSGHTTTHFYYADHGWREGESYSSLNASVSAMTNKIRQITQDTKEDLVLAYSYQKNIGKGFVHWVDSTLSKMIQPKIFKKQPVDLKDIRKEVKEFPKVRRHLMFTI